MMKVWRVGRERHSGRYAPLGNAGILRCAQNDDVKLTMAIAIAAAAATATATAAATATAKAKARARRNTGISPLRRQSTPPSVEMTFVMRAETRTSNRKNQELAGRRCSFPP